MKWASSLDIPLKASEELVSIDLKNDLPDDPNDLRTLLVEESSDKEHWLTIAIAYCNQGKVKEGINLVSMGLKEFGDSNKGSLYTFLTWANLMLAKSNTADPKLRQQTLQEAEDCLKEAINYNPTWVGNMLATVDLYYQRGQYDKALETSDLFVKGIHAEERRAGKQSKPNCMFLMLRAKLLYQKKNYSASLKLFQELLVTNPVLQPDPRIGIGLCFWQLKDTNMAIKSWKRALELNPTNNAAKILILLGKFHDSLTDSENDQQFREKFSEALRDLDSLVSSNGENPVLLTLLQAYYYFKGEYRTVIDIYEKKIMTKEALITNTILSESTFWCGRAYYALGDYRKSFTMFQESLRKNEDNLLAKFGVGQSQIKTNLIEESILTFENLYKTQENIQELSYILGLLYASKCLSPEIRKVTASAELINVSNRAIQFLEKYANLTTAKKNQLVIPTCYLVLSQLYELQNQYKKSLDYLTKAVDEWEFIGNVKIPLEIYNNLGCYNFVIGNTSKAKELFEKAKTASLSDDNILVSINFNIARTEEALGNTDEAQTVYNNILSKHPNYLSARLRSLFCKFIKDSNEQQKMEDDDLLVSNLIKENSSNLEVRSFYSWYLKNVRKNGQLEIDHSKETLVKYDSHDLYALISLGNLYTTIARDGRKANNPKAQTASKHSYIKALQLYQKVLQIDPLNIYAAQGIAIVFAENRRMGPALEILRKLKDSLMTEEVHINLGNCLLEMNDYVKAIATYELILKKFDEIRFKSYVLSLLGRAWYARGMKEKSVDFFKKSLSYTRLAIEVEEPKAQTSEHSRKFLLSLRFNLALLQFQMAETLRRASPRDRSLEDLQDAVEGLKEGISVLKDLRQTKEFNIVPTDELDQRIQLGETTMGTALERCLKEQEEFEKERVEKLEHARKLMEEQELENKRKEAEEEAAKKLRIEKQNEEFRKLQDEAQRLIRERSDLVQSDSSENEGGEGEGSQSGDQKKRKGSHGAGRQSKRRKSDLDSDEDEVDRVKVRRYRPKGKKSTISDAYIEGNSSEDEDYDDADDDGLF